MFDELLAQFGLTRAELNPEELDTLRGWADSLSQNSLTTRDVETHVKAMKDSLTRELAEPPKTITDWLFRSKRQSFLLARLTNYVMLDDFLTKPERAKKFVEAQLSRLKPKPISHV